MPRPRSERQAWEDERADIPEQIAALERDLDATPIANTPGATGSLGRFGGRASGWPSLRCGSDL